MPESIVGESWSTRLSAANAASDAGEWSLAVDLWEELRAEYPDESLCWHKAGEAYCQDSQLQKADDVLERAIRIFPDDLWIAYHYTVVAQRKEDRAEALARAQTLRDRFPDHAIGHVLYGESLRDLGRLTEADAAFAETVERFPGHEWALHGHAEIAIFRRDWDAALQRWEAMLAVFPHHTLALAGWGQAVRQLDRLAATESRLSEAAARNPDDERVWVLRAYLAAQRGDWEQALERWEDVQRRLPALALAQAGVAEALLELGRLDDSCTVIDAILAREPANSRARALREEVARRWHPHEAVAFEVRRRGIEPMLQEHLADPEVFIEITSICNFACTYCVSPMKVREKKQMTMETFRIVLEQVAKITTKPIRLHIDGEPTAHPQFKEMARLVNSHGLPIWLATNGSRLDPSYLDILMDPLISMSTNPEELAKRHTRLNFDHYIDRIVKYTAAWAKSDSRQQLFFQILRYHQPTAEAATAYIEGKRKFLAEFCRRAGLFDTCVEQTPRGDEVYYFQRKEHPGVAIFLLQFVTRGGLYPVDGKMLERGRATAGFCDSPWRQLVVHSNGTLGACCVDLSGGTTFASAEQAEQIPLKELWESAPQIKAMRDNFLHGRVERDVCQRCLTQGRIAFTPVRH